MAMKFIKAVRIIKAVKFHQRDTKVTADEMNAGIDLAPRQGEVSRQPPELSPEPGSDAAGGLATQNSRMSPETGWRRTALSVSLPS